MARKSSCPLAVPFITVSILVLTPLICVHPRWSIDRQQAPKVGAKSEGSKQQAAATMQINEFFTKKVEEFNELKKKNDAVDIALTTLASAAQGCFIGARDRNERAC